MGGGGESSLVISGNTLQQVWSVSVISSSASNYYDNYAYLGTITAAAPMYPIGVGFKSNGGPFSSGAYYMQWARSRIMPPNDIQPTISFSGGSRPPAPTTPTLTLSNTLIDQGQSILFTTTFTDSNPSYSYNYLIVNSITGIPISNMLFTGCTITTNTFFFTPPANLYTANTFAANVTIKDNLAQIANSVYMAFGYNAFPLITSHITPTPATQEPGNTLNWSVGLSGGTAPYTYNFLVYNSVTNTLLSNILITNSIAGSSFSLYIPLSWVGNSINANVFITDSASQKVTVNRTFSVITIVAPADIEWSYISPSYNFYIVRNINIAYRNLALWNPTFYSKA